MSRLTNLSVAAAMLVTLGNGLVNPVDAHAAPTDCQRIIVSDYSQHVVDELLAGGWTSDPTDGVEAVYAPSCAPDAHDSWPIGAGIEAVQWDIVPAIVDAAAEAMWVASYAAAGWTLLAPDAIADPDGTPHAPCLALVGPTTRVQCSDGYATTS